MIEKPAKAKIALVLTVILALASTVASAADKSYGSFQITVGERKITVLSPVKKSSKAVIVVKNETQDKIVSALKANQAVLRRFVLAPAGEKGDVQTFEEDFSGGKQLWYVSVAPPFQETPLNFSRGVYEIP